MPVAPSVPLVVQEEIKAMGFDVFLSSSARNRQSSFSAR